MSPIYDHIASNRHRTILFLLLFVAVITGLGWLFEYTNNTGVPYTLLAFGFATGSSGVSWFLGDKIALATSGARGPIKKEDAPELWRIVENLAITAGIPLPKIYLIEDGAINAFATGRKPETASIAVTTGAIQKLEKTELEGVIAHELSHIQNYDTRYLMLVAILAGSIVLLSRWFVHSLGYGERRKRDNDQLGGILLMIGIVLAILSPLFAQLIRMAVSRQREYLADASGALLTRYPDGLAHALEKIQQDTDPLDRATEATAPLYFSNPFGDGKSFASLFSTHPPIADRIARLRGMIQ